MKDKELDDNAFYTPNCPSCDNKMELESHGFSFPHYHAIYGCKFCGSRFVGFYHLKLYEMQPYKRRGG